MERGFSHKIKQLNVLTHKNGRCVPFMGKMKDSLRFLRSYIANSKLVGAKNNF